MLNCKWVICAILINLNIGIACAIQSNTSNPLWPNIKSLGDVHKSLEKNEFSSSSYLDNNDQLYKRGASISYGIGVAGLRVCRVSLQKYWNTTWRFQYSPSLQGYWDISIYNMHRVPKDIYNNKLTVVALAPVFRFYRLTSVLPAKNIYVECAIGVAQFSKRSIGTRELGTNFQFEDRLGFGMQFGKRNQYDIGYRVLHFSNAYLGKKNHGINLQMLYFNYWFQT